MPTLVQLDKVSLKIDSQYVFQNVSVDLKSGDYVALLGPNGAGKSTLVQIILGLRKPTSGQVLLWDKPVEKFRNFQNIGYVPQRLTQSLSEYPGTARDVIATGLANLRHINQKQKLEHVLELLKIQELANKHIEDLSGGQRQKVMLARGIVNQPQLLILDEPATGVDQASQEEFYGLLNHLNQTGTSILMVTHEPDRIAQNVNKLWCLQSTLHSHGQIQELVGDDLHDSTNSLTKSIKFHQH